MKKVLSIVALALVVSTSIISGTLAMYTTDIDALAQGSTVAKEFILTEGGTDTFVENVKIAPSETMSWQFSVKNFEGAVVSETAMDLDIDVDVVAADGKKVIAPLVFTVENSKGDVVGTVNSLGKVELNDEFVLSAQGQEKVYTVSVNWPSDNNVDINYAGTGYGTAIQVSVTGTQK
ncbi:hypothetical protein [Desulfitobacterium hafniense]|uniref:SipW-cognate class signal peptide n=3 Tax=Desulfitobacterium hafniense TaxID=49338 RepID=Q24NX3_DESHY|nr:hypothetical protein [Desulfitobacterium hafniense]ACL18905.1 hypothetical protein Dhaf_0842 [Desulfitobacterium hafniense DCB-2]KTE89221.1 hypothetical protein AT727_14455 [Desulfitobacterium hafniense]BAE86269.1 hypothetical protein DSY4480 [Desulfitobacterium hafniense Y51]